jgi:hypothetical protein
VTVICADPSPGGRVGDVVAPPPVQEPATIIPTRTADPLNLAIGLVCLSSIIAYETHETPTRETPELVCLFSIDGDIRGNSLPRRSAISVHVEIARQLLLSTVGGSPV